jgi:arginine decarboxylase-like protein
VKQTLAAYGYDAGDLAARMKAILEIRENEGGVTSKEAQQLLSEYRSQFDEYTYLT